MPTNTSFTRTYGEFETSTVDTYGQRSFEDVVSRASPLMKWLMNDDGVTGRAPTPGRKGGGTSRYMPGIGGDWLKEPLMTDLSDTVKWYSGSETFDTNEQNVGTAAFFEPKQLGVTITISGEEQRRNKGEAAVINLLQAKTDQALISIRNDLAVSLMGSGANPKEILGIQSMIPTDRGAGSAYGKITGSTATDPYWLVQRSRTYDGTYGNVGDFETNFRKYGKRLYHDCEEGSSAPDLHLVSQELMESYDDLLLPYERFTSKKARDLGFENVLTFMMVPVLWDRKHPTAGDTTQIWYMLNSEYMYLRYSEDANFTTLGFQRPANGDSQTTPVIWQGCFTTNNRRMHGVLTGITGLG